MREKVRQIRETAELLQRCLPGEAAALGASRDVLDLVAFRAYLLVQDAVDLASHVIADQGWGPAPSLRDHFSILLERGVLNAETAGRLSDAVKVRNIIGHAYGKVDPDKLFEAASELLPLAHAYCRAVLTWAEGHAAS